MPNFGRYDTCYALPHEGGGLHVVHQEGAPQGAVVLPQVLGQVHIQPMVQENDLGLLPAQAKKEPPPRCSQAFSTFRSTLAVRGAYIAENALQITSAFC